MPPRQRTARRQRRSPTAHRGPPTEIQDGTFADNWIAEYDAGLPNYKNPVEAEAPHPITETGKKLRSMMSWICED